MSVLLQATVTWILPTGVCSHLSRLLHMDIEKMDWQSISGVIECLRPYESWFTKSKKQNSYFYLNSPVRKFIYLPGSWMSKTTEHATICSFLKEETDTGKWCPLNRRPTLPSSFRYLLQMIRSLRIYDWTFPKGGSWFSQSVKSEIQNCCVSIYS